MDFTLPVWIPSLGTAIQNTTLVDAHANFFGVDALNADTHSWVLSLLPVEFDCQPARSTEYTIATLINESLRVLSTRNFTQTELTLDVFASSVTQWAMMDLQSRSAHDLACG